MSSFPSGFYRRTRSERLDVLFSKLTLSSETKAVLGRTDSLDPEMTTDWIENAIGWMPIPLGIATNFIIDSKERWIPMATEETSVIAAASAAAKWIVTSGGSLKTEGSSLETIGQMDLGYVSNAEQMESILRSNEDDWIDFLDKTMPAMKARGGGVRRLELRTYQGLSTHQTRAVLHVIVDTRDSMGANKVTQLCEALRPRVERAFNQKVNVCILSNLALGRLVKAEACLCNVGEDVGLKIQDASDWASVDPFRAATHNKGIMNGVDAVLIATGNDARAVEAGAHAYAARHGRVEPLSRWSYSSETKTLSGVLEMPCSVGTIGGLTKLHPVARSCLEVLGTRSASELARIAVAVGLAQNLSALRALVCEGLSAGHMKLHASNLALMAGATESEVVALKSHLQAKLARGETIGLEQASEALQELRKLPSAGEMSHNDQSV